MAIAPAGQRPRAAACDDMNDDRDNTLARAIAPEDIRVGDFVAVLNRIDEVFPIGAMFECSPLTSPRTLEMLRVQRVPTDECVPLKVEAVCLPWVLVKAPLPAALTIYTWQERRHNTLLRTIDVRRCRLARLSDDYGRRVYKMLKDRAEKKRTTSDSIGDSET